MTRVFRRGIVGLASLVGVLAVSVGTSYAVGTFGDDDSSVFEPAIEAVAAEGIAKGCNPPANDKFCPDDFVTRGQMAAFLARALSYNDDGGGGFFSDTVGHTFEVAIDKLATVGVTKGCNPPANDKFCPDDFVTRGQMAAFLVRALGYSDDGGGDLFGDDDGHVFEAAIDKLGSAGVTKGCNPPTNSNFCPDDLVTRGQMAGFLLRALGLTPQQPPTAVTVDSSGGVGIFTSIAIGGDGKVVVSYAETVGTGVKFLRCGSADCDSGNQVVDLDPLGRGPTGVIINEFGFPHVAWTGPGFHEPNRIKPKILRCVDAFCGAGSVGGALQRTGSIVAMTLSADKLPLGLVTGSQAGALRMDECTTIDCEAVSDTIVAHSGVPWGGASVAASPHTVAVSSYNAVDSHLALSGIDIDSSLGVGRFNDVAFGADGFPIVAYSDDANAAIKVAHCNDLIPGLTSAASSCSAPTTSTVATASVPNESVGTFGVSIAIGLDGLPLVAFYETTATDRGRLRLLTCGNPSCTARNKTATIDSTGNVGGYNSMVVAPDGSIYIAYYDFENQDLKVAHVNSG